MSTIFGILKKGIEHFELENDSIPEKYYSIKDETFVEIAHRGNYGYFSIVNDDLYHIFDLLPDNVRVYPLDNTAQNIYTVKDIKQKLKQ